MEMMKYVETQVKSAREKKHASGDVKSAANQEKPAKLEEFVKPDLKTLHQIYLHLPHLT
jgi:hypothetical protein